MDRLQRIYRLHRLLSVRKYPVSLAAICDDLECSRASVNRIFQEMRLYFDAPIQYDRARNGYFYARTDRPYELPGLWFSPAELFALLSAQHLLSNVQPGFLDRQLAPLRDQISRLLNQGSTPSDQLNRRIRILAIASRKTNPKWFDCVADAVLQRKRLAITYYSRGSDEVSDREVSPQRLTHYRDNWYLDAWCHQKKSLRIFAFECIRQATALKKPARNVSEAYLNRQLASGYGIFAGTPRHIAVLLFNAKRARWVAEEEWHPQQQSRWREDGRYELSVPYADPRELVMDILKCGADVEVVGPCELREGVKTLLEEAANQYQRVRGTGSDFELGNR